MIRANTLSAVALLLTGCAAAPPADRSAATYTLFDPSTGMTYNLPLRHSLARALPPRVADAAPAILAPAPLMSDQRQYVGATFAGFTLLASAASVAVAAPIDIRPQKVMPEPSRASAPAPNTRDSADAAAAPEPLPRLDLKLDTEFASARRLVRFAVGTASLGPLGRRAISELVPWAQQAEKVYVRGGADSSGNARRNQELAMARASAVSSAFKVSGVHPGKIVETFCSECYVTSNATDEGRRINRRVEVELVLQKALLAQMPKPVYAREMPDTLPLMHATALRSSHH